MNAGKIVIGTLAGLATGVLLGVLFAPDKGTETRKKIALKGADTLDKLKEKLDDLLTGFSEQLGPIREEADALCEKGTKSAEAAVKEMKSTLLKNIL